MDNNQLTLAAVKDNPAFARYLDLLIEWNKKFNLTSITDHDEVYLKHFLDSVLPAHLIPHGASLLDIGSGAGFPGICLKLVRPDLTVTLLDSVGKKVTFLSEVISALGLSGISATKSRIEDFAHAGFDVVTARAVASCATLAEYCLPKVKIGGFALLYKSAACGDELAAAARAIRLLGGGNPRIERLMLDEQTERHFVLLQKERATPAGYPRGGNKPRLNPL